MSSDWSFCPLIGHHVLWMVISPLIGHHVLWLFIMSSEWSSRPLIGNHVLWLVIMSSDWSACPLIGHHVLWLVVISSYWSSFLSCHNFIMLQCNKQKFHHSQKKPEWRTDKCNPTDAIASNKAWRLNMHVIFQINLLYLPWETDCTTIEELIFRLLRML